jgi:PAS domain S-box-containing protein
MPYQGYFKAASESLIIVDRQGFIVEANPKTWQLFGYAKGELLGQPIEVLIPERLRKQHRMRREAYMAAAHSRPMGIGMNLAGRRKDGSEFPVEVSLTYAPGTRRGDLVVAAVIDITERLALEREARRAETLTSLSSAAAGIAHDLNNPLSVVLSRAELLMATPEEALTPQTVQEDLNVIHRQAQRASRIVSGFLELSRHGPKLTAPVNLNDMVDKALLLMGDQMRKSGIAITLALEADLPALSGDAVALERVLINLLSNAREAMPGGGAVRLESGRMHERAGWLRLIVADNGPGIDPQALDKIFDLLYTTKPSGTGLGLWLSRRIVHEHKGKIEVQSELGKGTTFTLAFPIAGEGAKA